MDTQRSDLHKDTKKRDALTFSPLLCSSRGLPRVPFSVLRFPFSPIAMYIFGPVPSRRYGRSLGIDLVPMKTCCYDCVFCQLGPTPHTTLERRDYVPLDAVFAELDAWLAKGESADVLTLCGSGEPTLHAHFGAALRRIRDLGRPSLLMSNGALLWDPAVRADACLADRVKVSLHATVRPHADLTFRRVYDGLLAFRDTFRGKLDLEFFALPGLNDAPAQLNALLPLAQRLRPDTVTVNSAVRPPADSGVRDVPPAELTHLRRLFGAVAAEQHAGHAAPPEPYSEDALLALARRHPLTPAQFARYFGVPEETIRAALLRHPDDPYASRALLG